MSNIETLTVQISTQHIITLHTLVYTHATCVSGRESVCKPKVYRRLAATSAALYK